MEEGEVGEREEEEEERVPFMSKLDWLLLLRPLNNEMATLSARGGGGGATKLGTKNAVTSDGNCGCWRMNPGARAGSEFGRRTCPLRA